MRLASAFYLLIFILPLSAAAGDNPVLDGAQIKCNSYLHDTAAYRQCREETWKQMSMICNQRRASLDSVGPSARNRAEQLADNWCDAERKFRPDGKSRR